MKASIIISTNSNRTLFENFLISLSEYPSIGDYEIIEINDGGEYSISDEQHKQYGLNNVTKIYSDKNSDMELQTIWRQKKQNAKT